MIDKDSAIIKDIQIKHIVSHQKTITELEEIKRKIANSETKDVRFRVETKHWYGFFEPSLIKERHKLNISKPTMQLILEKAIIEEKKTIDGILKSIEVSK